jgi:hypothetical protein
LERLSVRSGRSLLEGVFGRKASLVSGSDWKKQGGYLQLAITRSVSRGSLGIKTVAASHQGLSAERVRDRRRELLRVAPQRFRFAAFAMLLPSSCAKLFSSSRIVRSDDCREVGMRACDTA